MYLFSLLNFFKGFMFLYSINYTTMPFILSYIIWIYNIYKIIAKEREGWNYITEKLLWVSLSHLVMSNSLQHHGLQLYLTRMKRLCFWTVVLEKPLESPLDCKEIQPVHPKGDQSWVFIGRTNAEAETPILWPLHAKSWLIGKDPDAGRD